ncbi:NUDIX hydrolase [Psychromicrobium sp. YIM B11713]|uniref:NUDIX hydrolase n=1 Tax=Psychromicrobium sp. YIM B11713 TaxID=3145233 RepID=UPI00374F21B7
MPLSFDTRPAAYAVIVKDHQILLAYWSENGQEGWTMPGGGLDLGEHPVDGAIREVFEETGYHARVTRMLGIDVMFWPTDERAEASAASEKPFESLRFLYQASITGGELTAEQDGTTTHAAWIPLEEVASLNRVSLVDIAIKLWLQKPDDGKLLDFRL